VNWKLGWHRIDADAQTSTLPLDGMSQPGLEWEAAIGTGFYQEVREVLVWVAPGAWGAYGTWIRSCSLCMQRGHIEVISPSSRTAASR
jgi:hypothetical protein